MQKQQKRNKIIHKIISSTFSKSSKRRVNDIPWDFRFDLDRLAPWWDNFCAGQKVSEEWKENFHMPQESFDKLCAKPRPYIQQNKGFRDPISVEKQVTATFTLPMKVGYENLQILLVWGNQQFRKLSCVFVFTLESFSLASLWQSNITISLTENHTELACLLKTNGSI